MRTFESTLQTTVTIKTSPHPWAIEALGLPSDLNVSMLEIDETSFGENTYPHQEARFMWFVAETTLPTGKINEVIEINSKFERDDFYRVWYKKLKPIECETSDGTPIDITKLFPRVHLTRLGTSPLQHLRRWIMQNYVADLVQSGAFEKIHKLEKAPQVMVSEL